MKKNILFVSILIVINLVQSCKKDKQEPFSWEDFYSCSNNLNLNSNAIANRLPGSWILQRSFCFWGGENSVQKIIVVNFSDRGQFEVKEDGVKTGQGMWQITNRSANQWGLIMTNPSPYLYGSINFCDNEVVFADSDVDGCDNLFAKD